MLSEEDNLLAKKIVELSIALKEGFDNLQKLEFNNLKDTSFYQMEFIRVKELIDKQNSLLMLLKGEPEKMVLICNELSFKTDFSFDIRINDEIASLKNNNAEDLIRFRLINQLFNLFKNEANAYFNINEKETILEESREDIFLSHKIQIDFINTVLAILKLYINDSRFENIKDKLLTLKYNLAFLHTEIEADLLTNNFEINPYLYWHTNNYLKALHFSKNFIQEKLQPYKSNLGNAIFSSQIEEIICNEPTNSQDNSISYEYVISQIFLRASLLFLGEDAVNALSKQYDINYFGDPIIDGINVADIFDETRQRIKANFRLYNRDKNLVREL